MSMKVAIYLRVSTGVQTVENQRLDLQKVAESRGWEIVAEYADEGISGVKGRDKRPAFDQLCKDATRGKFKLIAVWKLDRLSRSTRDLANFSGDMADIGVDLYIHDQAIDTSTATGKMFYSVLSGIAQFERDLTRERVMVGLERARAKGKTLGRPKTSNRKEAQIRHLRGQGKGIRKIASELGCGVSVVQRVVAAM